MMVDRYKYFRWTGRTAWITFAYVVAFPTLIGYFAYTTDVSENRSCLIRICCRRIALHEKSLSVDNCRKPAAVLYRPKALGGSIKTPLHVRGLDVRGLEACLHCYLNPFITQLGKSHVSQAY